MSFEVVNLDALRQIGSDHSRGGDGRRRSDEQPYYDDRQQRREEDGSVPNSVRSSSSSNATPVTRVVLPARTANNTANVAVSVVSSVGSFAPTLANHHKRRGSEGGGTVAQAAMSIMVDISQDDSKAGDVSTVGSFAPTLANNSRRTARGNKVAAEADETVAKEVFMVQQDSSMDMSTVGSFAPTLAHKEGSVAELTQTQKLLVVETDHEADMSTVGSFAPTLANNRQGSSSIAGGRTQKKQATLVVETLSSPETCEGDISTVGSFAPTLANNRGGSDQDDDDDDDDDARPTVSKRDIGSSSGHTRRIVDVKRGGGSNKDDGMSSVGSFAPTMASKKTAATSRTDTKIPTRTSGRNHDEDDISSVGETAPTLSSKRTTKTLRNSLISTTSSDDNGYNVDLDDISSVGVTAPTLSTKRTTRTLRNSLISTTTASTDDDDDMDEDNTNGDISSLGMTKTPTLAAASAGAAAGYRSVAAASVRNAISVVGGASSYNAANDEDCSTVGLTAPSLSGMEDSGRRGSGMSKTSRARASKVTKQDSYDPMISSSKKHSSSGDQDLYSDGLTFDHYASDMAYLGGVLGRDDLKSGLEDVVGTFLRRGAMVGLGIFFTLLIVALFAAPFSSYQYLTASEQIANATLLALMVSVNMNRLGPILINDKKCNWNFLSSGAMTAAVTVQFMSVAATSLMLLFPTPVMIDPIMGTRCHLVRWVEWCAVAFVMCFLTESIDLPLEDATAKHAWFTAISVALSSGCGGLFPFCPNKLTWWMVFTAAVVLFLPLYVRLAWRGFRLLRLPTPVTTSDKEDNERARYAFKLMVVCTTVWTYLVVAWIVVTLKHNGAEPGSFWANEWLILVNENICEGLSKIGYLSILLEVHEVLFDDVSMTARRLGELRSYMSAVWDNSTDVVIICSRHDYLVNAAVSPAFYQMETGFGYHESKKKKKKSPKQDQTTLIMEIDPYESSHRTYEMDLSKPMTRQEASTMMKNSREKARMVTPVFEKNLKVLGDLVCDSCTLPIPNGENQYSIRKQFYCLDRDRNEEVLSCDAKVVKLKGKTFLILLRFCNTTTLMSLRG